MTGLSTSKGAIVSNMKSRTVTITLSEDEWTELLSKHSLDMMMIKAGMVEMAMKDKIIHQIFTGRNASEVDKRISDPSVIEG